VVVAVVVGELLLLPAIVLALCSNMMRMQISISILFTEIVITHIFLFLIYLMKLFDLLE
jgi:hypothetical protein